MDLRITRLCLMAAVAATAMVGACDGGGSEPAESKATPPVQTKLDAPTAKATPAVAGTSVSPGAPVFAVLYPDAAPDGPATIARGPSGPGGMVSFTTSASPAEVIDFYRQKAEAAGLKAITTMNQSGTRGYSAGDGADGRGQLLEVVAIPVEDGPTSVQLSWASGR